MPRPLIPIRPSGRYDLRAEEMNCLTWIVISGCEREEAFFRFVRPDYITPKATPAIKDAVKQFFAMSDVQKYLADYKETISKLLNKEPSEPDTPKKPQTLEERKARAKTKATEFAISLADNIEQADDPEFVLKLMDKVGLLEQEDQAEEVPRRYLPVTCNECEYRKFVEENCECVEDGTELEGTPQTQNNE